MTATREQQGNRRHYENPDTELKWLEIAAVLLDHERDE